MPAENLNVFIAVAAGLVSFVSPCVLPLVPSYISFIGGQGLAELKEGRQSRAALMGKTLFFVLGFTVVFVLLGIVLSGTAAAFSGANRVINIVAGAIVFVFGANLLFNFISFLNYEKRFHLTSKPAGAAGSALLGMAFAAGWSPCIGPILASILALAASGSSVAGGATLLGFYSLGLALPFLLTSAFLGSAERIMKRIKPHMMLIQRISGVILIVIGILMILGHYSRITNWLVQASFRLRAWDAANSVLSRILFSGILAVFAGLQIPGLVRTLRKNSDDDRQSGDNQDAVLASHGWRKSALWRSGLLASTLTLSVLQAAGILQLPVLLAGWLSFQGI